MEQQKIPPMCRLCLTRRHFFYKFIDKNNNWAELINQLTGINPFADTRYPQKLCINCRKKLEAWSTFRKKCLKSQIQFREEFIDNQPSLDMKVEPELSLTPTPAAKSDDDMKFKEEQESDEGEFFELIDVVDNEEEVKDDTNPIKIEEVDIKSDQIEMSDIKSEQEDDKLSSSDEEPDFLAFEAEPENVPQIPKQKGPEPPVICDICGKLICRKTLEYHLNWHNDSRPYVCSFEGCNQSFNSPDSLKKHRLRHFDPKIICTVCGMKFYDTPYLKRHMLKHTKNWLNVCPHCSKKCATPYNLKVHLRIHTGDRPFSCNNCNATFAYNSLLKSHKKKCEENMGDNEEQ